MKKLALSLIVATVACGDAKKNSDDELPPSGVWGTVALEDVNPAADVVEVNLTASGYARFIGVPGLLNAYGYNGFSPGPLLEAKVGDEIIVHFKNDLPEPTTIHWHGLRISDEMDGTPRVQDPVPPGGTFEYRFVAPEAGSYWYHPHVRSHEQVERGLYGPIIIRGDDAPEYTRERVLMLDDILRDFSGDVPDWSWNHPEQMHGRYGDTFLTNGMASTLATDWATQGEVERWRIVNTANARTFYLNLEGASARVIGTDGGLLPEAYEVTQLVVAVGQRYDLEVVFDRPGSVSLTSQAEVNASMLHLTIAQGSEPPSMDWVSSVVLPDREPEREVEIEIDAVTGPDGLVQWRLNGESHRMEPIFTFERGETVDIRLVNLLGPEHPFHLHGQFFQILDQDEPGLKDTVLIPGGSTRVIRAYMDNPGRWMAHCHILEHVELGMMSEIVVE